LQRRRVASLPVGEKTKARRNGMVVILSIGIVIFLREVFIGITKSRKSATRECSHSKVANYDTLPSRHPI